MYEKNSVHFPPFLLSFYAFSQKVTVHVNRTKTAINSEWQILDENFAIIFPGSKFFQEDSVTFSLEADKRYFFSLSLNTIDPRDSVLYSLILNDEPLILIKPDIGTGDFFLPFFTGTRSEAVKITGGTSALITDFPWQVFVEAHIATGTLQCGGSIIAPNWILTAAHCTRDDSGNTIPASLVSVKAGANNPFSTTDGTTYQAIDVIPNADYNDNTLENDIALIRLRDPVNLPNARPVKMINSQDVTAGATDPGVMSWVTGWGVTHVNPNVFPTSLQKVQLPIISISQASTVWKSIPPTDIMAGYLNGNRDACSGDSGGPMVVLVLDEFKLAGIVSWGSSNCNTYGAYTRVSLFADWIRLKTGITPLFEPPAPVGDTLICKGEPSGRYIVSSVPGVSAYEWKLLPVSAGTVSGTATAATITWNTAFTGIATLAFRVTRNGDVSDWSIIKLRVVLNTRLISRSNDTTICTAQPVSLRIRAEGYNLNYHWFKSGVLLQSGPADHLDILSAAASNAGDYTVEITGACGTATSGIIRLTVLPLTNILNVSPDTDVPMGTDFTLDVNATGHNLTYQWQKDGINIADANGQALQLLDVNATNIGIYRVTVKGTCGTEISDSIYIYVLGKGYSGGPEVFLWPSVTNNEFNVAISNEELYNIQIYNNMGQLIKSYTSLRYQTTIDVSRLPKGIYIVSVFNKNFRKSLKLIRS